MDEDDVIALSALQHYLYCPRQCALIHVEQLGRKAGIPLKAACFTKRPINQNGAP